MSSEMVSHYLFLFVVFQDCDKCLRWARGFALTNTTFRRFFFFVLICWIEDVSVPGRCWFSCSNELLLFLFVCALRVRRQKNRAFCYFCVSVQKLPMCAQCGTLPFHVYALWKDVHECLRSVSGIPSEEEKPCLEDGWVQQSSILCRAAGRNKLLLEFYRNVTNENIVFRR